LIKKLTILTKLSSNPKIINKNPTKSNNLTKQKKPISVQPKNKPNPIPSLNFNNLPNKNSIPSNHPSNPPPP
jgi:hypothetical protein